MGVSNVGRHRGTVTVTARNDATGPFKLYLLRRHLPESHRFKLSMVNGTQPCAGTGTIMVRRLRPDIVMRCFAPHLFLETVPIFHACPEVPTRLRLGECTTESLAVARLVACDSAARLRSAIF